MVYFPENHHCVIRTLLQVIHFLKKAHTDSTENTDIYSSAEHRRNLNGGYILSVEFKRKYQIGDELLQISQHPDTFCHRVQRPSYSAKAAFLIKRLGCVFGVNINISGNA